MFQFKHLQDFFITVFVFVQLVTQTRSFQNNILHTSAPYNSYAPGGTSFPQRNPSGSTWQFSDNAGVPTWVITTTIIETRNDSSSVTTTKDEDSPVGPNLREDAMMAANESEDPDVEFPIRHGKDPAVHARPAFGDPEKYEETTSGPGLQKNVNLTKPLVTVNRTTVVKIEFHNTPFLPLVLNVGNAVTEPENKNVTPTRSDTDTFSELNLAQGHRSSLPGIPSPSTSGPGPEVSRISSPTGIDRAGFRPASPFQIVPERSIPAVQFPSFVSYEGAQVSPWAAQIPQTGVIYPYARLWHKK